MTKAARLVAAGIAAAVACSLMLIGAVSAPAAGPSIESYQAQGEARGLDVSFTFSGSIFERLVDLGVPLARSDVDSEAGGSSRGVASQVFPGDLIIGSVGEGFPGYRQAVYPPEDPKGHDAPDDTDTIPAIGAKPLMVETGHLITTANASEGSGRATTNLVTLGTGAPLITVKSIESASQSHRSIDRAEHVAQTIAHAIKIVLTPDLTVNIGSVVAIARTSSDGASPTADTSLTVSDVTVLMRGSTYRATIDDSGIHIAGAPQESLPSPLSGNLVPDYIPQDPNQTLGLITKQAGVQISTAPGTKVVDDVSGDASLSGLLITFTGNVPDVFVPSIVDELVYGTIEPKLPAKARKLIERSICYEGDIKPLLPPSVVAKLPDLPLCFSPQIVPGPGSGVVTTFSIGKVHSSSAAVQAIPFVDQPGGGGGGGGGTGFSTTGGTLGGGGTSGGITQPSTSGTTGTIKQPPLTGLVARLPSAALYGTGIALFILAIGLAMGPSLRRWQSTPDL